jgi:hypothetical protein
MDPPAQDLWGAGIRVNSVLNSIIDADWKAISRAHFEKWPKAENLALAILFLRSDDAKGGFHVHSAG